MRFHVLGPLGVTGEEGPLPLGGPVQRLVLAHLLLRPNVVVPAEVLIDDVWGEEPPGSARNTLQSYVSRLRGILGAERLEHRPPGYRLNLDPEELDSARFEGLLAQARAADGHPERVSSLLGEALGLWAGQAFADVSSDTLAAEVARLDELRVQALEGRIKADLELGRHGDLVGELEVATRRWPLRERLWAQLMLALYRSGRQGDALAAFGRARELLAEELGVDPSAELLALHERILRQDPSLEVHGEPLRGYRLLEKLGEGAFGEVYRASQPQVGRDVAVKVVHPELANRPDFVRRFEREAQLVARLEHPHVVPLYDYWREPDAAYLVMRYLRGGNLEQLLAAGALDPPRAAAIVDQIASGLSAAHRQGIVHRDVKPANVLLDDAGNAYLGDFGVALDADAPEQPPGSAARWSPAYLSPEQIRLEPATPRSDVYALGVVVYELLTGVHPFGGGDAGELLDRHLHRALPSVRKVRPEIPAGVDAVIARATAKDPSIRFGDAAELAAAFRAALEGGAAAAVAGPIRNPFKGLRAFLEADAGDFFGREALVRRLVERLAEPGSNGRFLCVVGPSGSGKSSLVRAGVVPALRRGAIAGSDRWFVVEMVPGAHPLRELEAALLGVAVEPPPSLLDDLERDDGGLLAAVDRILPDPDAELLLVVDQLEEAFTLTEDAAERARFLDALAKIAAADSRVRVVATLRADFFDRPLSVRGFGELLAARSEAITPMSPDDLERAIAGPAERVGLVVDPALVATMVADVVERPGALPLLQFALTELAESATDGRLTVDGYREVGAVSGALARRAEQLYGRLTHPAQDACRQVMLRLVALGEGSEDTRRRVRRTELAGSDRRSVDAVIEAFGRSRLLSFDRDPETREPTVEIAHEALLTAWVRLRSWVDEARDDLRTRHALDASAAEWETSGHDDSYLLRGTRLDQLEAWAGTTTVELSPRDEGYLEASLTRRNADLERERTRVAHERSLERRSVGRMRALVGVLTVAALVAAGLTAVAVDRGGEAARHRDEAAVLALTGEALSRLRTDPPLAMRLVLHAFALSAALETPVPAATVEALHWSVQQAAVQYPADAGPIAGVGGPLGFRGIFDVPAGDLANLALARSDGTVPPALCERIMGSIECPALPDRFSSALSAEPVRADTLAGDPLAGTTVRIGGVQDDWFAAELDAWSESSGIRVVYTDPDIHELGDVRDETADVVVLPQPGLLPQLAADRRVMDLGDYLGEEALRERFAPYLVSLGSVEDDGTWPSPTGSIYGAMPAVSVKSLIWYRPDEFRRAGYTVPTSMEELDALVARIRADGRAPWCMGLSSDDASGWPATDWVEDLLLATSGTETYDAWTFHEIGFQDPAVGAAFARFGDIVFTPGNLPAGPQGAIENFFDGPAIEMYADPPRCWLYHFPSFFAAQAPEGTAPLETFPFPSSQGLIGGGSMLVALSDRPEVRAFMDFLTSPSFGTTAWFTSDSGSFSANIDFDVERYAPEWRDEGAALQAALANDTFRFDASDQMPPPIGNDLFWSSMIRYVEEGPSSLDAILADLDAAWPSDP